MTKRFSIFTVFVCGVLLIMGGIAYPFRVHLRTAIEGRFKPTLPTPTKFSAASPISETLASGDRVSSVEGGVATSQRYILVSSPTTVPSNIDPFEEKTSLPDAMNLDVPFVSQAPTGNWDEPYQEACEEASVIMVDAFYRGISGPISSTQATRAIDELVAYEKKTLGFYKDTDAKDTAGFIKGYFGYANVMIVPFDLAQMHRAISNGFPVIVPADGKKLPNPYFRNGGPPYHMVVVKGYAEGKLITNDPGTSRGADFIYTSAALQNAAHDWNDGDVKNGAKLMIVIIPPQR